jgi:hypothetical protein
MKRFARKSILFAAGFALLFGGVSYYYRVKFQLQDTFFKAFRVFNANTTPIRVLFLGDSHTHRGIKNRYLPDDFYNFASDSESLRETYLKLQYAHRKHPELQYIVLPFDYHMLSSYRERAFDLSRVIYYADVNELANVYGKPRLVLSIHALGYRYLPLLYNKNREMMILAEVRDILHLALGKKSQKSVDIDECGDPMVHVSRAHGGVWTKQTDSDRYNESKNRAAVHFTGNMVEPEMVDIMDRILAYCEQNDIKVIGITYPLTLEYQKMMDSYAVDSVMAVYDAKPSFHRFNYVHLYDDKQELFHDPDHLNSDGSVIFTGQVVRDIKSVIPAK